MILQLITAGRYGTLMMATRYVIMMTNTVIKSSFLLKSLMMPPLGEETMSLLNNIYFQHFCFEQLDHC